MLACVLLAGLGLAASGCASGIPGPFAPTLAAAEAARAPGQYPNINTVPLVSGRTGLTPGEQGAAIRALREEGQAAAQAARSPGMTDAAAATASLRRRAEVARRCAQITDPAALPRECR